MSAKIQGKKVIDLTNSPPARSLPAPGAVQPRPAGARRLVVKNLRVSTSRADAAVAEHYKRAWANLEAALESIFAGRAPRLPWETLARAVEDLCRNREAEKLADMLRNRCEAHLSSQVLERVRADAAGADDVAVLRVVLGQWKTWSGQLVLIRRVFSYLNQSFLLHKQSLQQINDMGIAQFRRAMFVAPREVDEPAPGPRVLAGLCELIDYDRRGDAKFDSRLLKESISMLFVFNVYGKSFEPRFLQESRRYFDDFAEEKSTSTNLKGYIDACVRLLNAESFRCIEYNFDSTTKRQLIDDAHQSLIQQYSNKLLDGGSVAKLLADNDVVSVKALYDLLGLSGLQSKLKAPWEDFVRSAGAEIVGDTKRGDEMVVRLLELRRCLDILVRDAFYWDDEFVYALREAFGHFINDKATTSPWDTGTSKVGEMIAKYMDMLLRGGLKTLPTSLLSDLKDRAQAEESGLASTGDEDAELDRQLDNAIELFRFIEGKDVFEAFYKRDLARRLLMGRSASQDAERNMLAKLKSECGSSFTHNLEQMFKDQELARDEMTAYKQSVVGAGSAESSSKVDLHVSVLSAAAWPPYPDVRVHLPKAVWEEISRFDKYYKRKHTGRRLTWKHNLAHCSIKAQFKRGPKELLVSAFQAAVLMLFNEAEADEGNAEGVLAYEQIAQGTGLQGGELERTLQSLACGKVRVLTKHPKGRDVARTDTFTVNAAFADPKYRVKINQIQLKETKEENQETHKRVAADRQFETQAAIVRIMKSRKTMPHAQLVAEVINQTKSRGAVDAGEIKKNIEK